jgi:hypothetical protein
MTVSTNRQTVMFTCASSQDIHYVLLIKPQFYPQAVNDHLSIQSHFALKLKSIHAYAIDSILVKLKAFAFHTEYLITVWRLIFT